MSSSKRRTPKKDGKLTIAERKIIEGIVAESDQPITNYQAEGLARAMRRRPQTVKAVIAEAREKFAQRASEYVDIHHSAVKAALEHGSADALDVAVKGSQWAIEHMSAEGQSVLERAVDNNSGAKIMIGVVIGGQKESTNQ